ncbi:MAG: DUF2461 domain-containing protein [Mycobacterium sp.]
MAGPDEAFRGWPAQALQFYEGLEADNSKTYWAAHQQVYDEMVLGPMTALLAELKSEFGPGKVFRPNRDVRFSADKSPYKLHIGATLGLSYIQLSATGLAAASGMHRMAADQLDRYRHAVADEGTGTGLEQIIRDVQRHAIDVRGHDTLKTAPKGYSTDHPRLALLQHKGITAWKEWPVAGWLATATTHQRITGFLRATQPLNDWLITHVDATTLPQRRR